MRSEHYKQVAVVSAPTAEIFEQRMNATLAGMTSPEIVFDQTRPFTATIIYRVRKDVPETLLELLEMIDANGGHTCNDCPYLSKSKDKRVKWHMCTRKDAKVQITSRACESYYESRLAMYKDAIEDYRILPYEVE